MKEHYFISKKYKPNLKTETIDNHQKRYWSLERISQSYYTRYILFKFCKKFVSKFWIKNVFNIGCGPATSMMQFLFPVCKELYGVDQDFIIQYCKKKYKSDKFYTDDIEKSTLDLEKKFDLILSFDVIEHLLNPNSLINYIKRFAYKNSYVIITTPERDVLRGKFSYKSPKRTHVREWNKIEFYKYLKFQGFTILAHTVGYAFNIFLNFNNPIRIIKKDLINQLYMIKKFNKLKKIRHCQMVLCTLNNNLEINENLKLMIKKFNNIGSIKFFDIFRIPTIWIYLTLFRLYQYIFP